MRSHDRALTLELKDSRAHLWALGVLVVVALIAIGADVIAPHDPRSVSPLLLQGPSADHWLGTDDLGRDVLSGLIYGARISLLVGFTAGVGALLIGVLVGAVAGYYRGAVDNVLMRVAEIFQVMPSFILALVIVALLGRSIVLLSVAIVVAVWPQSARLVRGQMLSVRGSDLVLASKSLGYRGPRIIFLELLPGILAPVLVQATLDVGRAILLEAGLSFLGLGDPNFVSWGEMLQRAQPYLATAWWMSVPAGGAILLVVLSVNVLGDGLNDRLNPRRRNL